MANRSEFETAIIITGDDKGGVKVVKANRKELEALNQTQDQGKQKTKEYGDQHKKSEKDVGKFSETVQKGASFVARAATVAATALTGLVGINTKLLQQTDRTAKQLGISTQAFQAQSEMARLAGLEQDAYGDTIRDVSVRVQELASVGTGEAFDFFDRMNLDVQEFRDLAPDELIKAIGQEMQSLNRNERILFLDQLGSDNAVALVDVITRLDQMEEEAIAVGAALSDIENIQISKAAEGIDKIGMVARGAGNQITAEFAPIISDLSDRLFNAAVEAGGIESAVEEMVTAGVAGIGFMADRLQDYQIYLKKMELAWFLVGSTGSAALAENAEAGAILINDILDPFVDVLANIADGWGVILLGFSQLGGRLNRFKKDFETASDTLSAFSRGLRNFEVTAEDVIAINERMQNGVVEAQAELALLLSSPPPSEGIEAWLEEVRAKALEAAGAEVAARESQEDMTRTNEDATQKVRELVEQMEFENSLIGLTSLEQKVLTNLRRLDSSATDDQKKAVRDLTVQRHNAEAALAAQIEREKEMAQTRKNAIENIQRNLGDMLYDQLVESEGDWNDYFDNILKGWARVQTELAANNLVDALFNGGSWNIMDILGIGGSAGSAGANGLFSLAGGAGGLASLFGGGGAAVSAGAGTYGLSAEVLAANGYTAAGSGGFLAGAGGFLQAAAPWMLGAFALNALFNKDQTLSGNAGFLLHDLDVAKDRQFEMAPFASGLQPTGFNRRTTQGEAIEISDLFRMADQRAFDILAEAGITLETNASTFAGLDERGLGSYRPGEGIFFGSAGEEGIPGRPVSEQIEMYLRQALASVADQLDPDDYQAILQASGADGILAAMQEHLVPVAGETADSIQETADVIDGLTQSQQRLLDTLYPLDAQMRQYQEQLAFLQEYFGEGTAEYIEAVSRLQAEYPALFDATEDAADAVEEFTDEIIRFENALSDAQASIQDVVNAEKSRLESLRDLYKHNYEEQLAAEKAFYNERLRIADRLADAATGLRYSRFSPLSKQDKFQLADSQFDDVLARVNAGDVEAGNLLPDVANALAQASADMWGSTAPHKEIMAKIFSGLDGAASLVRPSEEAFEQRQLDLQNQLIAQLEEVNDQLATIPERMAGELAPVLALFIGQLKLGGKSNEFIANQIKQLGPEAEAAALTLNPEILDMATLPSETAGVVSALQETLSGKGSEIAGLNALVAWAKEEGLSSAQVGEHLGLTESQVEKNLAKIGIKSFGKGGISVGSTSGYYAQLHGPEAVIPLPDGRSVPVSLSMSDAGQSDQMVGLLKEVKSVLFSEGDFSGNQRERMITAIEKVGNSLTQRRGEGGFKYDSI